MTEQGEYRAGVLLTEREIFNLLAVIGHARVDQPLWWSSHHDHEYNTLAEKLVKTMEITGEDA